MSWRASQNRLADFVAHGNTALLPLARLNNAMSGDDEAVRNGDDDGDSGADLELFRQLVAMPPKKCRRAACSSMSLCGVATSNCPNKTRNECSGSRHRRNGVSATSHRTSRIINAANGSIIVGYARAEKGAGGRQHKGSWSIGRFRSGLPEGVCDKAVAAQ